MGKSTKVSTRTRRQGVQGTLMLPLFPYTITTGKRQETLLHFPYPNNPKAFAHSRSGGVSK